MDGNDQRGPEAVAVRVCVIYVKHGLEQRTPWFSNPERARRALEVLRRRYGAAVLLRD